MKVLNKVLIGVASLAMLTACASKCDYATFNSKAKEAVASSKEVTYSQVVVSGWSKDENGKKEDYDKITVKFDKGAYVTVKGLLDSTAKEIATAAMLNLTFASLIPESEDYAYYAGSTFKVEDKDGNTESWNKYGLLVKTTGEDSKLTISYKK